MCKQGLFFLLLLCSLCLSACLSGAWTGANLIYDRHHVYEKIHDYRLIARASSAMNQERSWNKDLSPIEIAAFHGDLLIVGQVPSSQIRDNLDQRLRAVEGYKKLYNEINIGINPVITLKDSWITTKIRSKIFADSSVDPRACKIVTFDRIVYLMGEVAEEQAKKIIYLARNEAAVRRVVNLLHATRVIK